LGAGAAAAAPDSMVWSAAPGERSEVRGLRQQPAATALTLGQRGTIRAAGSRRQGYVSSDRRWI